jgi:hypothetical protein
MVNDVSAPSAADRNWKYSTHTERHWELFTPLELPATSRNLRGSPRKMALDLESLDVMILQFKPDYGSGQSSQPSDQSHSKRRQILAEDEDQIVLSVTFIVFFAGNRLDAQAVADKCVGQVSVSTIAGVPVSQRLVAHLAQDMAGAVPHPEIDPLKPLELELLTIPDQRHENPLLSTTLVFAVLVPISFDR